MDVKIIVVFLIFMPFVQASSLGIFPVNESLVIKPLKNYNYAVFLFNPSNKDVKVVIDFYCNMDGAKYFYADVFPKETLVPANTSIVNPIMILIRIKNPLFFERSFGEIKYYIPLFGERDILCRLNAKTQEQTSIIVTSTFSGKILGINPLKIFIVLMFVVLFIFFKIMI